MPDALPPKAIGPVHSAAPTPAGPSELGRTAAKRFARCIGELFGGAIVVRLDPSGQLVNDRKIVDGLKLGQRRHDRFRTRDHPLVLSGIRRDRSAICLARPQLRRPGLGWTDWRGLAPHERIFGASVTSIPFTDMFMALKLGVADRQENPGRPSSPTPLTRCRDTQWINERERRWVLEALAHATARHNDEVERAEAAHREKRQAAGMEFLASDVEPFRLPALERVPRLFSKDWKPGLHEAICRTE